MLGFKDCRIIGLEKYRELVLTVEFFRNCEVEIEIPKKFQEKFCDFPPLFSNTDVATEIYDQFTSEYSRISA